MKLTVWARNNWTIILFSIVSIMLAIFISLHNIESITQSRLATPEVATLESSSSLRAIIDNPFYAPFKIVEYVALQFSNNSIFILRSVTALFGIACIFMFYRLSSYWYSPLLAWLGTAMFATSALYLHHARLAVSSILAPLLLLSLLWAVWNVRKKNATTVSIFILVTFMIVSLYIPGFIWFGLLILALQRRHLKEFLADIKLPSVLIGIVIFTILLFPLLRFFILNPNTLLEWAAIPTHLSLKNMAQNIINVPLSLAVRSNMNPVFNLGRLPYLDLFTIMMTILGTYAFVIRLQLVRTKILILSSIICLALVATEAISIVIFLPVVYLLATGGIMFLLQQWYSVFPKNPIARVLGLTLLVLVINVSIFYNLNRYFVAWANNPATADSFQEIVPPNLIQ